jgi:hypothetical protein
MIYERLKRKNVIRERNILQTLSEKQKWIFFFVTVYMVILTKQQCIGMTLDMVLLFSFHVCLYVQLFIDIQLLVLVEFRCESN